MVHSGVITRNGAGAREWVRATGSMIVVIPLVLEHTAIAFFGIDGALVPDTVLTAISRQLLMTLGRLLGKRELAAFCR